MGNDRFFRALSGVGTAVVDWNGLECTKDNLDAGLCNTLTGLCARRGGPAIEVVAQPSIHACSGSNLLSAC